MVPLNRTTVERRLADLKVALARLDRLATLSRAEFLADPDHAALAAFYLLRAIENILSTGSHILVRLGTPVTVDEYRQIVPALGRAGIVSAEWAERNAPLGSYRNRLVHHYVDITNEELYNIVRQHRGDLRQFGQLITDVLDRPDRFDLTVE